MRKILQRLKFYRQIRFFRYLYLNYFCRGVVRTDQSRIIPYRGAVLDLAPGARILLGGGDLELGCDRMSGSRAETLIRLRPGAVWSSEGGCRLSYGTTLEVLSGGLLDSRFFTMNSGSVLVAAKRISLGHDVMIGRNVVIYDSDHHTIRDNHGLTTNPDAPVTIGDHVWLATGAAVLKGTVMGAGCVAAASSTVRGILPPDSIYRTDGLRRNYGTWRREHPQ